MPSGLDEFGLIARLFAPLTQGDPNTFNLQDDAAIVPARPGYDLVVTKDAMVAGVHFLPDDPADAIAKKLLRVNLSDLAAKGAEPYGYLLATAFPRDVSMDWLDLFAAGLKADQAQYGIHLLGGDTVATDGPLTLSLTALGHVPQGTMALRRGAKPGDRIFVTGTIGDALLGLRVLRGHYSALGGASRDFLIRRYRLPEPRTNLGPRLRGLAHAMIDVSDGLVADLGHIVETSGVAARIELQRIPLSEAARAVLALESGVLPELLSGGDDYELLFAAPPSQEAAIRAAAAAAGVPLAAIGTIEAGQGVSVLDKEGKALTLDRKGFSHF